MFCFRFKTYALSNSRVAVQEATFFVHRNCCQLFQRTFSIFFSVKLETYSAAAKLMNDDWFDVNNFVSCSSVLVSSTQRNTVLPCELRIPESKLLCELPFSTKIPTLWCFSHSKPAIQNNSSGRRWPPCCFDSNDM